MRNWCIAFVVMLSLWSGLAQSWADAVRATCPPVGAENFFYPAALLHPDRPDIDQFVRAWYSSNLAAMHEPSLSCGSDRNSDVYRFLWLRSFHHPIAVRITREDRAARLEFVELSSRRGNEPGKILRQIEKQLSPAELNHFEAVLIAADFWEMPVNPSPDEEGLDGARWIIEGRRAGDFHLVDRYTPRDGSFRALGILFLKLADVDVPPAQIY